MAVFFTLVLLAWCRPGISLELKRRCFTRHHDFLPGALEGEWTGISDEEWLLARFQRQRYGNLSCSWEEENKSCGRQVGIWAGLAMNGPDPRGAALASKNAEFAHNHMVLRPHLCDLGPWDAIALADVLAGGRTLLFQGDSTMRQLFAAVACSIPQSLVAPPRVRQNKHENIKRVELVGGGALELKSFPDDQRWIHSTGSKRNEAPPEPEHMAKVLLGSCPPHYICIVRPTLHNVREDMVAQALRDDRFTTAVKRYSGVSTFSEESAAFGWSIVLTPSSQHFRQADSEDAEAVGEGHDCRGPTGIFQTGAHAVARDTAVKTLDKAG
jgi:hypothetical protein